MAMENDETAPRCWVLTDGKAGMETQCLGLAEALGLAPEIKRISMGKPWRWLPPQAVIRPLTRLTAKGDGLAPPWPDLLIASGRKSVAPAIAIRKAAGGRCFTVQIQNPAVDLKNFDMVVTPLHDGLSGDNVVTTLGAMGRVTPALLAAAADRFAPRYRHLPRPRVAVLVGGSNGAYRLTPEIATALARSLADLARREGAGLMVTASRRTGGRNERILHDGLAAVAADLWDGSGENPYFGILGLADHIVVTADSVNMVSEAAASGKPVHVVALEGGSRKFDRFHDAMAAKGITRAFDGRLATWAYPPLCETARVAALVRARLAARPSLAPGHLLLARGGDK
ncbi:MAG TPA: mitochondrial fission ELM1 family protein [Kiloniellaceae bacterium]|nr:mitochondrial fission ELM1 family protein [Kiloniellaceae bacterium]